MDCFGRFSVPVSARAKIVAHKAYRQSNHRVTDKCMVGTPRNVLAGPKGLPESRTVRDAIKLGFLSSREPIDITQLVECDSKMSPREEEGDVSVGGIKDPSGTGPRSW